MKFKPLYLLPVVPVALILGVLFAVFFRTEMSEVMSGSSSILKPDNAQVVAEGEQLYATYCATCHGANREGQKDWQTPTADGQFPAPPHDETGHTWHHSEELLFNIVKLGSKAALKMNDPLLSMPAFEGQLDDEQIIAVLSWIQSTWPEDVRELQRIRTR